MGTGFWIIQAMLLFAAVVTAVYVERENNHRDGGDEPAGGPDLKVRIEYRGARRTAARWSLRAEQATADGSTILRSPPLFSGLERARLLAMRRWVEEARAVRGRLYDDLAPAEDDALLASRVEVEGARRDVTGNGGPSPQRGPRWSTRTWVLLAGGLLLVIGCIGIWHTNDEMNALEQNSRSSLGLAKSSLVSHVVPTVVSNPGKYLSAVNSSSGGSSAGSDPLEQLAMLALKQAMDRYLAVLLIGIALVMASETGWVSRGEHSAVGERDGAPQPSSIGNDLVPIIVLAGLCCAALSFFELA